MSTNVPSSGPTPRELIRTKAARLHILCPTIPNFEWDYSGSGDDGSVYDCSTPLPTSLSIDDLAESKSLLEELSSLLVGQNPNIDFNNEGCRGTITLTLTDTGCTVDYAHYDRIESERPNPSYRDFTNP